ncbi:DNA polymerase V [Peribacillus huizhouensis]|uniref:DNA polymerase V n=1 Tax=Peribacillus huizhouensis TaxID=1501239 RepID=A0ABR6CTI7_9BACI|nr:DNA polymerase V [Peribacillus huizhouensis]
MFTTIEGSYRGNTVRQISLSISNLVDVYEMQIDLFEPDGWKKRELGYIVDKIRNKFGASSLLRAGSFTTAGTALHQSKLVGGHKK